MEVERIISKGSSQQKISKKMEDFYTAIIKKYYNATDVQIDYHRRRVKMNVILDESLYQARTANVNLPMVPVNLFFLSFGSFLKSCLQKDNQSIAFYATLLSNLKKRPLQELLVH